MDARPLLASSFTLRPALPSAGGASPFQTACYAVSLWPRLLAPHGGTHFVAFVASVLDSLEAITLRLSAQGLEHWASQFPACIPGFVEQYALVREAARAARVARPGFAIG